MIRDIITTALHDMDLAGTPAQTEASAAIRRIILGARDLVSGSAPDTVALPTEDAFWLGYVTDALQAFDLDECAEETCQHPAIVAEHTLEQFLAEHAPATFERLGHVMNARYAEMLGA